MLLAFMNKALSAILTINRILETDVRMLGFLINLYIPLYSDLKTLFDFLDANFKILIPFLPTEVLQKYKNKPVDVLSYFFSITFLVTSQQS